MSRMWQNRGARPAGRETSRARIRAVIRTRFLILTLIWAVPVTAGERVTVSAIARGAGVLVDAQRSWLDGGFGRLDDGGDDSSNTRVSARGAIDVGLEVKPSEFFRIELHGVGHADQSGAGEVAGLTEGYVEFRHSIGASEVRVRGGEFFLPTSRENVGMLWSSPYVVSFSAINSWIAHEVRPIGVDAEWRVPVGSSAEARVAATGFGGNDAMGSLLAWRGWAISERLSVTGEVLPLPPLPSLRDPAMFGGQRSDGTRPIENDLDGRAGYAGRFRWGVPSRYTLQVTRLDNRGDRELHRGEYAWRTRFTLLSADYTTNGGTTFVGEWMNGDSGMGLRSRAAFVQIDFSSAYVLVSHAFGRHRFTFRAERFRNEDRDRSTAEYDDDDGRAFTASWRTALGSHSQLFAEIIDVNARHPAAETAEARPITRSAAAGLQLSF